MNASNADFPSYQSTRVPTYGSPDLLARGKIESEEKDIVQESNPARTQKPSKGVDASKLSAIHVDIGAYVPPYSFGAQHEN